jgi:hypothetical protein
LGEENLSFSVTSADEDKKMTEEEAESAEIIFWNPFAVLAFREALEMELIPMHSWALSLRPFLPLRALRPLWLSFFKEFSLWDENFSISSIPASRIFIAGLRSFTD